MPDPDDMVGQINGAFGNLEDVLHAEGMTLSDVVELTIYTTDVPTCFEHFGTIVERLEQADVRPAQTFLGVASLALPEIKVEIRATAVQ